MRKYLVELRNLDNRLLTQHCVWAETEQDALDKAKMMWPNHASYSIFMLHEGRETK